MRFGIALVLKCCLLVSACASKNTVSVNDECDLFKFAGGGKVEVRSDAVKLLDTRTGWFESEYTVMSMEIEVSEPGQLDIAASVNVLRLESLPKNVEDGELRCLDMSRADFAYCYFNLPSVPLLLSGEFQPHDDFNATVAMQLLAERVKATVLNCPSNESE